MLAACHGNADMVQLLLGAGADVFTADSKTGAGAPSKACRGGNVRVARLLVEKGACGCCDAHHGIHAPIMDALWYKWPAMVQFLVDQGANLHLSTHYGFSMMEHFQFELNVNTLGKDKLLAIDAIFKARQQTNQDTIARQTVMAVRQWRCS
jgi:ankyrin repeat protein